MQDSPLHHRDVCYPIVAYKGDGKPPGRPQGSPLLYTHQLAKPSIVGAGLATALGAARGEATDPIEGSLPAGQRFSLSLPLQDAAAADSVQQAQQGASGLRDWHGSLVPCL